jgi:hypothetical protein
LVLATPGDSVVFTYGRQEETRREVGRPDDLSDSEEVMSARRVKFLRLLPILLLVIPVLPSSPAHAQATRTWVSGVGDDANPCSRTAPCKTFAGAISKTATNGEINTLDPGGFGGVTITKSITISGCTGAQHAGVLVSGTNAIVVNAPADAKVTLRCLDINGLGTSLNGIRWIAGKSLKVTDTEIYGFTRDAIDLESSTFGSKAVLLRNFLHDNTGLGVMVAPPNGSATNATLSQNDIVDNGCGVAAAQFGPDPAFNFASNCGTSSNASGINAFANVNSFDNLISESVKTGVFSRGAQATNRIGNNRIANNFTGLQSVDSGVILSFGNNLLIGNASNGAPTGPVIPPLRPAS